MVLSTPEGTQHRNIDEPSTPFDVHPPIVNSDYVDDDALDDGDDMDDEELSDGPEDTV